MSDAYLKESEKGPVDMRKWCQRPGRMDENGDPIYTTEQNHKKECDVNEIIKKYDKEGLITHVSSFEASFGDMTGNDFTRMQMQITDAINKFNDLPSEVRNRFDNSPAELLRFMENPENRAEAIKLGMIRSDWTEDQDGLGEHVVRNEKGDLKPPAPEEPPA